MSHNSYDEKSEAAISWYCQKYHMKRSKVLKMIEDDTSGEVLEKIKKFYILEIMGIIEL